MKFTKWKKLISILFDWKFINRKSYVSSITDYVMQNFCSTDFLFPACFALDCSRRKNVESVFFCFVFLMMTNWRAEPVVRSRMGQRNNTITKLWATYYFFFFLESNICACDRAVIISLLINLVNGCVPMLANANCKNIVLFLNLIVLLIQLSFSYTMYLNSLQLIK